MRVRAAVLAATVAALVTTGLGVPAANACTGTPCEVLCDVYQSHAYRMVFGDRSCPR